MRRLVLRSLLGALLAVGALAAPAAAGPELVSARPFDVSVSGKQVTVTFTLTLSEVSDYPVTITAICCGTEEELYKGTLSEGTYRLNAALTRLSGSGPLKVVLKTRITNRSDKGSDTFTVYKTWQGSM